MKTFPAFYPIVDSAPWVKRIAGSGVRIIQLRIKQKPADEVRRQVRDALACCAAHDVQLVVNDHWEIALSEGADYIHLGQDDLDHADRQAIRRRGARLGISTHDQAELERALSLEPDYVALGPIYPTTLKVMPWAPQGLARIGEWKRRIGNIPLIAIGGITLERASLCRQAGANSVAVVSDVVSHAEPLARIAAWLAAEEMHA